MKNIPSEPYPTLPAVLGELVSGVRGELGSNLIGVYLVGSLASGDFDHDSDIDFLVVTKRGLWSRNVPA